MPIHKKKAVQKSGLQQLEDSLCHQVLELHEKLQLMQRKSMALRNLALKHQVNILHGEKNNSGINLKPHGLPQCDVKAQEKLRSDLQAAAKLCGICITKVDSNFAISDDDLTEVWSVEGELRSHTFKMSFIREGKVGNEANMKVKEVSTIECLPHHQKLDELITFMKEVPQPYMFFMGLFSLQELMEERTKAEHMLEENVPDLAIQKGTDPLHFSYLPSADLVINFEWDFVWNRTNLFRHNIRISCTEEVKARYSQKSEISSVLQQESLDSPVILMEFFEKFD
ncbi:uncharacterized protein LOC143038023 isoform X2 [Oratosquilla oratoria]